ncbi:MAG: ABC transporter substrate-binding protein [Alphaproteobacteria bacterium]|nr:ABC transporter substrate-binding protein [Alphaproteobacteria bacterium]
MLDRSGSLTTRRTLLAGVATLAATRAFAADPVLIGVSGPLTGPAAQYGAQWKKGFDLALEEINGAGGGIKGRPLEYRFEDSQNDPRQSVAIAQKFVGDPKIVVELGDFSSPASMAASPIYQRGKLVQFGFTNSHPDFTKGGDYMWSNSLSQSEQSPQLIQFAVKQLELKKLAILHLNTDWGRTSKDLAVSTAKSLGAEVVAVEGYMPEEKDFRSTLVRVRDAKPDGVILISYYADAALIARQTRVSGITQPLVGIGSIYSPKFIELAGDASEGVYSQSNFFPEEPRAEVQNFVKAFSAKYKEEPDTFSAYGYDTMVLMAAVMRQFGTTRADIRTGLEKIRDVPSVIFSRVAFDPETRRVSGASTANLQVKGGKFVSWDGKAAPRS